MLKVIPLVIVLAFGAGGIQAAEALIHVKSESAVPATVERLVAAAEARGFKIVARVDHAAAAAGVDMELRPTTVVIFGNPRGGTPLMQCDQRAGLDLPLKVLVWENATGETHLTYDHPRLLGQRHHMDDCTQRLEGVGRVLKELVDKAASAP
jgi:uncharacterized protein (DUF302 family)